MEKENKDVKGKGEPSCCNTKREDCPHCGRCPKCGRKTGDYTPRYPYPYDPYPWYPHQWYPNTWVYCTHEDTGNVTVKFNGS